MIQNSQKNGTVPLFIDVIVYSIIIRRTHFTVTVIKSVHALKKACDRRQLSEVLRQLMLFQNFVTTSVQRHGRILEIACSLPNALHGIRCSWFPLWQKCQDGAILLPLAHPRGWLSAYWCPDVPYIRYADTRQISECGSA